MIVTVRVAAIRSSSIDPTCSANTTHLRTRVYPGGLSLSHTVESPSRAGCPELCHTSQCFFQGYTFKLPTSLNHIQLSARGCSPWRPDAVLCTDRVGNNGSTQWLFIDPVHLAHQGREAWQWFLADRSLPKSEPGFQRTDTPKRNLFDVRRKRRLFRLTNRVSPSCFNCLTAQVAPSVHWIVQTSSICADVDNATNDNGRSRYQTPVYPTMQETRICCLSPADPWPTAVPTETFSTSAHTNARSRV